MVESSPQRAEAQVPKAGGRTGPGKTAAQGGAKSPKDRKKGECLFCFVFGQKPTHKFFLRRQRAQTTNSPFCFFYR